MKYFAHNDVNRVKQDGNTYANYVNMHDWKCSK